MGRYCVLSEIMVDDVLTDWRRYCASRRMSFGGFPAEDAHTIAVVSEEHRMHVTIGSPEGTNAAETLALFLADYVRRRPHLRVTDYSSEQELLTQTQYEGSVGFIID